MKGKEIIHALRAILDDQVGSIGFKFNKKFQSYIREEKETGLSFEVSFLMVDHIRHSSKYVELFTNIYHKDVSKILLETSVRKSLGSIFYFKLMGNLLSDIVLNPNSMDYSKRNNHNYFKLIFSQEPDFENKTEEVLNLIQKFALPFFDKFNSLEKIFLELDQSYDKCLAVHNSNNERLLALAVLSFLLKNPTTNQRISEIMNHFTESRDEESKLELRNIISRFEILAG